MTRPERFDALAILFHWLVAVLIVVNVALAWSLDNFDHHDPVHNAILSVHKSIGVVVLVLAVVRLIWRWTHPAPLLPEAMPRWMRLAAQADQVLLYAILFVMPITGLIDAGGFSEPVNFFFLFELPPLIGHDEPLGHAAMAVHKGAALVLYALLLLHSGAALFHHYVLKDQILQRMLPLRSQR